MAFWLLKTEPGSYSFDQLVADRRTCWDGIKSPAGKKHLRSGKAGDQAVIYHTGDERQVIGTAKLVSAPYDKDELPVIDIEAGERLAQPVPLSVMKADPVFEGSPLVREGRLSFLPLTDGQWKRIMALGQKKR